MSIISKVLSGSIGKVVDALAGAADRFIQTPDEKAAFKQVAAALIAQRDTELEQTLRTEMEAKERVLIAELAQGDSYTKRARPTVVYSGLLLVFINHVVLPWISHFTGSAPPSIEIPAMFWTAWGGICGTWVIGRTFEKRGTENKLVSLITGS